MGCKDLRLAALITTITIGQKVSVINAVVAFESIAAVHMWIDAKYLGDVDFFNR
jgi:hypothetical protein